MELDAAPLIPPAGASDARRVWEMENKVTEEDRMYIYDELSHKRFIEEKPWSNNQRYFTEVKISAVALLKMVLHARTGGDLEVMGLMQGKIQANAFVVMDAVPLPVEGTETRVNAQQEGNEYMVQYMELVNQVGRKENCVGWYHSHPGYGCWLSGIDVSTQMDNQRYLEPFVAVVIDPKRTVSGGKVDIGAFRTLPERRGPAGTSGNNGRLASSLGTGGSFQSIPLEKIEDFGVHCVDYYPLEVTTFKSSLEASLLEALWNKYWQTTLSQSQLVANHNYITKQITDLADKIDQAECYVSQGSQCTGTSSLSVSPSRRGTPQKAKKGKYDKEKDEALAQVDQTIFRLTRDCSRITQEVWSGITTQMIKKELFADER